MAKWYVGMILAVVIIIGSYLAMTAYPWFSIETEYPSTSPVDTVKVTYSLKEYEIESRDELMDLEPDYPSLEEGTYKINDKPEDGGWDGDHDEYELSGRPEQLKVYSLAYNLMILTILMAVICVILIPLAGLGKIPVKAAVGVAIVMTIFAILGPIYYGIFMPIAFDDDNEEIYEETKDAMIALNTTENITKPESLQSIWGDSSNIDVYRQVGVEGAESHWRPALGWWITIVLIFLAIVSIGMIDGPRRPRDRLSSRDEDDYYGDRREDWDTYPDDRGRPPPRDSYDRGRGPPPDRRDDYDRRPPPPDYYDRGGPPGRPPNYDSGPRADYGGPPPPRAPPPDPNAPRPPPPRRPGY
jgi:hypothetical protein